MLKTAFGEQAMGCSQTFQWFSRFKALVDQCPVQKGIVHKEFVPPGQTVNAALKSKF